MFGRIFHIKWQILCEEKEKHTQEIISKLQNGKRFIFLSFFLSTLFLSVLGMEPRLPACLTSTLLQSPTPCSRRFLNDILLIISTTYCPKSENALGTWIATVLGVEFVTLASFVLWTGNFSCWKFNILNILVYKSRVFLRSIPKSRIIGLKALDTYHQIIFSGCTSL